MIATLETRIKARQPVLICSRCDWWAYFNSKTAKIDIEAFNCPDCHSPIDAVEQRA